MRTMCEGCDQAIGTWDYRYHGKHYCRKCYDRLFKLRACTVCNQQKKISIDLEVPICKICQVKDQPCIRCQKIEYIPGKITENGPVCNSCAKYFREYKTCSKCQSTVYTVSNRTLKDGTSKLLCHSCYHKLLPVCSRCRKQRPAHSYDDENKPVCKTCFTEEGRECRQCGKRFPAGAGRICQECAQTNTLVRRTAFGREVLSSYMSEHFTSFSDWLKKRRNVLFAATHISRYLPYFVELDNLSQSLSRHPSYEEVVGSFTVAKTREFLLVTLFLEEIGLFRVDKKIQEEYANIDMIERYLDRFQVGSWQRAIMDAFSAHLHTKLRVKKSSIRSIRLTMGTAAKFVQYCDYFNEQKLTNDVLHGFLWKYPGQRNSITGFVNFINRESSFSVKMPEWKIPELAGPKESHMRLKQQLIDQLREERSKFTNVSKFLKISIEYLHGVGMPNNVFIDLEEMKTSKDGTHYIRLAGKRFYLPKEIPDIVNEYKKDEMFV